MLFDAVMIVKSILTSAAACAMLAGPIHAALPTMGEQPWMGYFVGFETKKFRFTVDQNAKIMLVPLNYKGEPVSKVTQIPILYGIEETNADGKTYLRKILPETLSSSDEKTSKLEKCTITGKVTGDAAFELHITQERGVISLGGRMTDPGKLTKNPVRFIIRPDFPNSYPYDKKDDKKGEKAFEKKIADDRIDIKWTDGKKTKLDFEKDVDANSNEVNGPGVAATVIEIAAYKDMRFMFTATPDSVMKFSNEKTAPLYKGFALTWQADPEKDKEGKARLSIEVK